MHLEPLWTAGPVIASHALLAIAALALGLWQLAGRKGGTGHRVRGWAFAAAMALVTASALLISEVGTFGYFSWIHLLVPYTAVNLFLGIRAARRGRIDAHRATMVSLFVGALVVAGAFTFLPYRVMNDVVTGRSLAD